MDPVNCLFVKASRKKKIHTVFMVKEVQGIRVEI